MSVRVVFAKAGEAEVLSIGPDAIVLRSTVPWPPGSRIEGALEWEGPAGSLRVKVHSSRRTGEGHFVIEGRPIDLPRQVRERLASLTSG